jgi:putative salt-induced outer membrane protein
MFARLHLIALGTAACAGLLFTVRAASAQDLGAPPPDAKKEAAGPDKVKDALKIDKAPEGTTASLSAGGLSSTGNSKMVAFTGAGLYDSRFGKNGYGASLVGNYGRSAPPEGGDMETTTQNLQGRLRYDRYVIDDASVFLLLTGRHDKFQGLSFRLNVDPGFKYLFVNQAPTQLWAEAGYDFQYDIRNRSGREIVDDMGMVIGELDKTETDHSARLYVGFRHSFNEATAFSTGLEYLQSFVESERYRLNYDALFTAKFWGNLALGVGFLARYDHAPLPTKEKLDTTSTLSIIYSYSDVVAE